jgi:hypothetical protein
MKNRDSIHTEYNIAYLCAGYCGLWPYCALPYHQALVIDCRLPDDSDSDEEDAPTSSKEGMSISGAAGDTGCTIAIDAKPVAG